MTNTVDYNKHYYQENKERIRLQRIANGTTPTAKRAAYLKNKSCVKCGSTDRMEIDHIDPSTKITHQFWSSNEADKLYELSKCQVLCHACHRAKSDTEKRKGRRDLEDIPRLWT